MIIAPGATSQTVYFAIDDGAGLPVTGLAHTDIQAASYVRDRATRSAIGTSALGSPLSAYSSGGFILIDDTNCPGLYRFDIPNAAVAAGVDEVIIYLAMTGGSGAANQALRIQLTSACDTGAIADAVWDEARSGHETQATFGEIWAGHTSGNVVDASPTATVFETDVSKPADAYLDGQGVYFTSGTLQGLGRRIADYDDDDDSITVETAFPAAPANGDNFIIVPLPVLQALTVENSVWDATRTDHIAQSSFGEVYLRFVSGNVSDVSPGNSQFDTDLSQFTDEGILNDKLVMFTSGVNKQQARRIKTFSTSGNNLEFYDGFASTPANGDDFLVLVGEWADVLAREFDELTGIPAKFDIPSLLMWILHKAEFKIVNNSNTGKTEVYNSANAKIAEAPFADAGNIFTRSKFT